MDKDLRKSLDFLRNPFNDVTRRAKRNLLLSSVIGIAIVKVGLIPTKINALGIELTEINTNAFLLLVGAIIFCFLVSYSVYVLSEMLSNDFEFTWNGFDELHENMRNKRNVVAVEIDEQASEQLEYLVKRSKCEDWQAEIIYTARFIVDGVAPIAIAIYALFQIYAAT